MVRESLTTLQLSIGAFAGEAEGRPAEKLSKKKRREQKRRELELLEGDDLDDGDGNEPASFLPPQTAGESESAHKGSGSGGGAAAAGEAEARDSSGDSSTEAAAGFELVDRWCAEWGLCGMNSGAPSVGEQLWAGCAFSNW